MAFLICRSSYLQFIFSFVTVSFNYVNLAVCVSPFTYNKHYHIPRNSSATFTGRNDVIQRMYPGCLATNAETARGGRCSCIVFSTKN